MRAASDALAFHPRIDPDDVDLGGDVTYVELRKVPVDVVRRRILEKCNMPSGERGCWLWKGGMTRKRTAMAATGRYLVDVQTGRTVRAVTAPTYRVIWEISRGRIPRGKNVVRTCAGGHYCMNVDHMALASTKEKVALQLARGTFPGQKFSQDDVDRMRDEFHFEGKSYRQICRKWGIKPDTLSAVITGQTWRER